MKYLDYFNENARFDNLVYDNCVYKILMDQLSDKDNLRVNNSGTSIIHGSHQAHYG